MTEEQFKKISTCETAFAAWNTFEVIHEGTSTVKNSKIQRLTTEFETIRMSDKETFDDFHEKLKDIVNNLYNLGEVIPESSC